MSRFSLTVPRPTICIAIPQSTRIAPSPVLLDFAPEHLRRRMVDYSLSILRGGALSFALSSSLLAHFPPATDPDLFLPYLPSWTSLDEIRYCCLPAQYRQRSNEFDDAVRVVQILRAGNHAERSYSPVSGSRGTYAHVENARGIAGSTFAGSLERDAVVYNAQNRNIDIPRGERCRNVIGARTGR